MIIRSDGVQDVGPGIETISVTPTKPQPKLPERGSFRVREGASQSEPVEQLRQLFPAGALARREHSGLSPAAGDLMELAGHSWISTLLEAGDEVTRFFQESGEAVDASLGQVLLEDINNVEILGAYRRALLGG